MAASDAVVAVALAGSLFFDIDPNAARWRVTAYLLFSLAPFAIVAPFIGPMIDRVRGGRRIVVVAIAAIKVLTCLVLTFHLDSWAVFPLGFLLLVLQKAYAVSRMAMVPSVVQGADELVEANAKLSLIAGFVGFAAAIPALMLQLIDPKVTMALAVMISLVAVVVSLALPRVLVAAEPADELERAELRSAGILLAASAMAVLRAAVGFLTFLIAFSFRRDGVATAWFGVVAMMSVLGMLAGNGAGGFLRERLREERMLLIGLVITAFGGVVLTFMAGLGSASFMGLLLGFSAAFGRLGFDAIVQRDAPDANRGRAFARFETRFQLAWVLAAAVPVVFPIPLPAGFFILGITALAAAVSYLVSSRRLQLGQPLPEPVWRRTMRSVRRRVGRDDEPPLPPSSAVPPPKQSPPAGPTLGGPPMGQPPMGQPRLPPPPPPATRPPRPGS